MRSGRFFCFIIGILMLFSLTACAPAYDEVIGVYSCARLELDGEEFHVLDVYPKGCTLRLSSWGQAWLSIEDESFYGRWELVENDFVLDINGTVSHGKLKDGICLLTLADSSMEHLFLKEGASLPQETAPAQQSLTPQQIFWNGDWYGKWTISNADGNWLDQNGQSFDCFASIDIDSEGEGTMSFWDELQDSAHPIATVQISVTPDGNDDNAGVLVSSGGYFLDYSLDASAWKADPDSISIDSVFYIEDAHYVSDKGSFDYTILLRPWGRTWEDIQAVSPDMLPYFYYDWYLPTLAAGGTMPENFEYTRETIIRNTWSEPEQG